MERTKTRWLLAGVLSLLLWPASAAAQRTSWKEYMEAAGNAYQQADYVEAEKLFKAALREAEKFGEQDPRFATSLNNLAALYQARGKYVEAEPLYKRSLAIREGRAALRALAGDSGEGSGARPSRCSREPQQLGGAL
jgi:tetratricopeptide (TPR) repeat protein